uniref:Uncharacterized protein n=1 Tax=Cyanothece sp. (strain PCC 7425 / ATCC 29141) TaxID=395961 RepID=B8HL61_CYAP4
MNDLKFPAPSPKATAADPQAKKSYHSPGLSKYGSITNLTTEVGFGGLLDGNVEGLKTQEGEG